MKSRISKCIVDTRVYLDVLDFTSNDVEWGGIGIGSYDTTGEVLLKGILFPPQLNQSLVSCAFETKHVALLRFALEDLGLFAEIRIVAWVHSHPGHGISLSQRDREIQEDLFLVNERLVALVIEPKKKEVGAFSGILADQRISVERRDLNLREEERVKLAMLSRILPQMVGVFVPAMPMSPSSDSLMKVISALTVMISKLRNWLVTDSNQHQEKEANNG